VSVEIMAAKVAESIGNVGKIIKAGL